MTTVAAPIEQKTPFFDLSWRKLVHSLSTCSDDQLLLAQFMPLLANLYDDSREKEETPYQFLCRVYQLTSSFSRENPTVTFQKIDQDVTTKVISCLFGPYSELTASLLATHHATMGDYAHCSYTRTKEVSLNQSRTFG